MTEGITAKDLRYSSMIDAGFDERVATCGAPVWEISQVTGIGRSNHSRNY